jgi:CRP-like cAMP-binding protein
MNKKNKQDIPTIRLSYNKNDLIIRQGDYGVSIYYIISGRVEVYTETDQSVTTLAILEPGEVFGEMVFLYGSKKPRSASVRAIEPTVLEIHHSASFLEEYKKISPMLKYVTDQALKDLLKINRKISDIDVKMRENFAQDPWSASRRHFRKDTNIDCLYKPLHSGNEAVIWGRLVDISRGGLKMSIKKMNTNIFPHKKGAVFSIAIPVSKGGQFTVDAKIIDLVEQHESDRLSCRMAFTKLNEESLKKLGFFMMEQ